MMKEEIYPPSSVADAPASPQGEAFYVTSFVRRISTFFEAQRIRNPKSKIALSNRLPLGGKLARQRLMRGDKSPLSPFDISTPVNPALRLLIETFLQPLFLGNTAKPRLARCCRKALYYGYSLSDAFAGASAGAAGEPAASNTTFPSTAFAVTLSPV